MDIQLWMDGGIVSVLCAISMSYTLFVPKIRQMEETAKQNHVKYLLHTSLYNAAMSRERPPQSPCLGGREVRDEL